MSQTQTPRDAFLAAFALALGATVALGFARFAYALLLPAMRQDLGWSYAASGGMNTANAVGYLLGALLASGLMRRLGVRRAFVAGLVLTSASLLASGASANYLWLVLVRLLAGLGGAVIFVSGGVLVAHVASGHPAQSGRLLGTYYAGAGLGIVLSGVSVPFVLAAGANWRVVWVLLGVASLLLGVLSGGFALRFSEPLNANAVRGAFSVRVLFFALCAYACFALGYIAYMTFAVAFVKANGAGPSQIAAFWAVLGMAAMLAPWVWATPITRWFAARGMAACLAFTALGAALPLVSSHVAVMLVSAAFFGGSFLSVVAATTALARRYLPSESWSAGIALFTVVFAAGQSVGPLLSGVMSDGAGGLRVGLAGSALVLLLGAILALGQGGGSKDEGRRLP